MSDVNHRQVLAKSRGAISKRVRELRKERRWTQAELAGHLGLSQARLSEIEGGDGSFTAEQFLLLLKLFNVGVSAFASASGAAKGRERETEIQNALARLGALHLQESRDVLPTERLEEVGSVVRETLVAAESPRLVTALAPVLVVNVDRVNLNKLQLELSEAGLPRRLPWLIENVLAAIEERNDEPRSRAWTRAMRRAYVRFQTFLDAVAGDPRIASIGAADVLDANVRTVQSRDELAARASEISKRWRVITSLGPENFAQALASADALEAGRGRL